MQIVRAASAYRDPDLMPLQHEFVLEVSPELTCPVSNHVIAPSCVSKSFYVVHIRQILYSVRQDVMPSSLVQLVDFPGALKMAQRILRRGGILLIHEPQISLYSVWEGFQVNDLAPYLAKVSQASANLISSAQWVQLVRGAFAHRGIK